MKKGFTLAEILITLGIVGVVAVLTVPGVMKNYSNRMYVSQLQKAYSLISEATQSLMNDEHVDNFKETSISLPTPDGCPANASKCTAGPFYFLYNYFKTAKKNCANDQSCMSKEENFYKTMSGKSIGRYSGSCIQTVSGMAICANYNSGNQCTTILVDVNSLGKPNVAGRDIFVMDIHSDGSISDYESACMDNNAGAGPEKCGLDVVDALTNASKGCLNNIIQAGWKMEY